MNNTHYTVHDYDKEILQVYVGNVELKCLQKITLCIQAERKFYTHSNYIFTAIPILCQRKGGGRREEEKVGISEIISTLMKLLSALETSLKWQVYVPIGSYVHGLILLLNEHIEQKLCYTTL